MNTVKKENVQNLEMREEQKKRLLKYAESYANLRKGVTPDAKPNR